MSFTNASLNDKQRAAVQHTEGPCLIVAGPGSGKTRVLTHRVAHLMAVHQIPAARIMVLAFTQRAAREMQQRLEAMVGAQAADLELGTFHRTFSKILRREVTQIDFPRHFSIYDNDDSKRLIARIRKELHLMESTYPTGKVLARMGQAKRAFLAAADYAKEHQWLQEDETRGMKRFHEIYHHYQQRCRQACAMDFDDLIYYTWYLFQHNPDCLAKYQERFAYLLVDEAQDMDRVQYNIVEKLAQHHRNLCLIGDDAQAIYGFRGDDIRCMLDFPKRFPEATTLRLEENYRSTQQILKGASVLMQASDEGIRKTLFTQNALGEPIHLLALQNGMEEAAAIAERIAHTKGVPYDQIAILYRANNQSGPFEKALWRKGIPFQVVGNHSFYQRREVKDLLAYLNLLVNPHHEESLLRAINQPKRQIGIATLQKIRDHALQQRITFWESLSSTLQWMGGNTAQRVDTFVQMIQHHQQEMAQQEAHQIAHAIAEASGLLALYQSIDAQEGRHCCEHLETLLSSIHDFCHQKGYTLTRYLEEINLMTDDSEQQDATPKVKLMTIHRAKGTEFDQVYIAGVEEGYHPSHFAIGDPQKVAEERRLLFVGMTRARNALTLTYTQERYIPQKQQYIQRQPSRFLQELDPTCLQMAHWRPHHRKRAFPRSTPSQASKSSSKLQKGARLTHSTLGAGIVQQVIPIAGGQKVIVDFITVGRRTLQMRSAR